MAAHCGRNCEFELGHGKQTVAIGARVPLSAKRHNGGPKYRARDRSGERLAEQSPPTGDHGLEFIVSAP